MKLLHQTKSLLIKNYLFFIPFILFVFLLYITIGFSYKIILGIPVLGILILGIPLLAIILVVYFCNKINGIILLTISIILYIIYYFIFYNNNINIKSLNKEGFWSPELVREFIVTEKTINRNFVFDPTIVQEQASEDDVKYFLEIPDFKYVNENHSYFYKILQSR